MREDGARNSVISDSVLVDGSSFGNFCRFWREAQFIDSKAGDFVSIGDASYVLRSELESHVSINRRNFVNDSKIGALTYTGVGTSIHKARIGRMCSIGGGVEIGGGDHDYCAVSTYIRKRFSYVKSGGGEYGRGVYKEGSAFDSFACTIGNDVWVGSHATILGKVSVGDGAVIGAGAVVVKDVPPYAIVVGVPARVMKYRFSKDVVSRLLKIAWWDWPLDKIFEYSDRLTERPSGRMLAEMEAISSLE